LGRVWVKADGTKLKQLICLRNIGIIDCFSSVRNAGVTSSSSVSGATSFQLLKYLGILQKFRLGAIGCYTRSGATSCVPICSVAKAEPVISGGPYQRIFGIGSTVAGSAMGKYGQALSVAKLERA
jgi:hypothetical protein